MSRRSSSKKSITYAMYGCLFTYALAITVIGPLLTPLQKDLALSNQATGSLFSLFAFFFVIGVTFGGLTVDTKGARHIVLYGQGCLVLALLFFVFAPSKELFGIGFLFLGLAGGFLEASTNSVIAHLYPKSTVKDLNLLHIYFGIGALIGPFLSGSLFTLLSSWRISYGFCFGLAVLHLFLCLPLSFPKMSSQPPSLQSLLRFLKEPFVIILGISIALYVGSESSINNWGGKFMEEVKQISKLSASTYLTLFWATLTLGRWGCTLLTRFLQDRDLLLLLSVSGLLFTLLFYFLPSATGIWIAGAGFFYSGIVPTLMGIGSKRFPHSLGVINGVLMMYLGLGMIIFPYLVGFFAERVSLQSGMVIPVVNFLGLAWLSLFLFLRARKRE